MTSPLACRSFAPRPRHRLPRALLAALAVALLASCASAPTAPLPTVAAVDLARYQGRWFEIARLPNRFQRQCVADTEARYQLDGDTVRVRNRCRSADGRIDEAQGVARVVEGSANARLRVSFFWPFYGDYWVLALDPDYQWVWVGEPGRRYAWILARTPQLPAATLQQILQQAAAAGFDASAFQTTPQTRALPD